MSLTPNTNLLTPPQLKQLQIMQISMLAGQLILFFVILYFHSQSMGLNQLDLSSSGFVIALTAANFALLAILYPISVVLPVRFLRRYKKVRGQEASGRIVVSAQILRIFLLTIPSTFGLITCFFALTNGLIYEELLYWVNILPFLVAVAQLIMALPNHEKIEAMYGSTFTD